MCIYMLIVTTVLAADNMQVEELTNYLMEQV